MHLLKFNPRSVLSFGTGSLSCQQVAVESCLKPRQLLILLLIHLVIDNCLQEDARATFPLY